MTNIKNVKTISFRIIKYAYDSSYLDTEKYSCNDILITYRENIFSSNYIRSIITKNDLSEDDIMQLHRKWYQTREDRLRVEGLRGDDLLRNLYHTVRSTPALTGRDDNGDERNIVFVSEDNVGIPFPLQQSQTFDNMVRDAREQMHRINVGDRSFYCAKPPKKR